MRNVHRILYRLLFFIFLLAPPAVDAQEQLALTDLSFFQSPGDSWSLAGEVQCGFKERSVLIPSPGTGILINRMDGQLKGRDLFSKTQYGGMDMELDFMMAPGSASGIYLQGRYGIMLRDSWGTALPTATDNGAIFERYAPRQNVSRAPGLWQHIKISFQAPRFNAVGKKIDNAKILFVELNGIRVQDQIVLTGPSKGAMSDDELPLGPLCFQGDLGSVAFRNILITPYDHPNPQWKDLKYAVFKGAYDDVTSLKKVLPVYAGSSEIISLNLAPLPPVFLIRFTGKVIIKEPGAYHFTLNLSAGRGSFKLNDQSLISMGQGKGTGSGIMELKTGEYPFEIVYSKLIDYAKPALRFTVAGPGIRVYPVTDANIGADQVDPILLSAPVNTVLRSFSDIGTKKVTHAVNVGTPLQVHYTYDMENAGIVQVWRGDFLDVTTMWHGRGDGTAHPRGMIIQFGLPVRDLEKLHSKDQIWSADTTGSGYRPKGYILDDHDLPVFRYSIYQTMVNDQISILQGGRGIHRVISLDSMVSDLYLKLATAATIEMLSDNLFLLDGKTYYLQMDDTANEKPFIRDAKEMKELIIPVRRSISYSILF